MLKTNSPAVHVPVSYARVMGERVNMNREGLMSDIRTYHTDARGVSNVYSHPRNESTPIKYVSMARPDQKLIVVPLSRPRTAARKAELSKPHAHPGGIVCQSSARKPCELVKTSKSK